LHDKLIGNPKPTHMARHSWPWSKPTPTMEPIRARRDEGNRSFAPTTTFASRQWVTSRPSSPVRVTTSTSNNDILGHLARSGVFTLRAAW